MVQMVGNCDVFLLCPRERLTLTSSLFDVIKPVSNGVQGKGVGGENHAQSHNTISLAMGDCYVTDCCAKSSVNRLRFTVSEGHHL